MAAGDARLKCEIVVDRQARDQIELLEHQPEPVAPQFRAAGIAEFADQRISQPDLAAVGGVEPGDQMQQRALAAAGLACQRDAFARRHRKVHPAQHRDLFAGRAVAFGEIR